MASSKSMRSRRSKSGPDAPARPPSFLSSIALGIGAALVSRTAGPRRGSAGAKPGKQDAGPEARHDGRGRDANAPQHIPAPGWKDILWRTWEETQKDRLVSVAASVTFYLLLALAPAVAAFVSVYGLVADPGTVGQHLNTLSGILPEGAVTIIGDQVTRITRQGSSTLSLAFATSLVLSLWSANAGMKAVFDALNVVYGEEEKRSFIRLNAVALAFTLGAIAFMIVALVGVVAVPVVLNLIGLDSAVDLLLLIARWPILLVVVALGLAVLYRYGPSRDEPRWRWVTWGSGLASLLWLVASLLFSWYAASFGSYNETYGSLGALVGFMTWMWISCIVVLLGAQLNAEMEHQTARDTTRGPAQPMGRRGARMADTLGQAKG